MSTFSELIASRRSWIDEFLIPWCRSAARRDLLLAEHEWTDLAGRPAPEMTLWLWAWGRFPDLCREGMQTINETDPVRVQCRNGSNVLGFPDARRSIAGQLVLVSPAGEPSAPISIDDILAVIRISIDELTRSGDSLG